MDKAKILTGLSLAFGLGSMIVNMVQKKDNEEAIVQKSAEKAVELINKKND